MISEKSTGKKTRWGNVGLLVLVIALALVLIVLIGVAIKVMRSQPEKVLELPGQVQIHDVVLADCARPKPEDFATGLENTGIRVFFVEPPAATVGEQTVNLVFDDGYLQCVRQAKLKIFHLEQKVSRVLPEAGAAVDHPGIEDFISDRSLDAKFLEKLPEEVSLEGCGENKLTIACDGREYEVIYALQERVPPTGTPVTVQTEAGILPDPATLVTDVEDQCAVTVTYEKAPHLTIVGRVPVTLVLTDSCGNTSKVESVIEVVPAANAPQFQGLEDLYIRVGETISYKADVKAVDPQDGELAFSVNASGVDQNTEGTYIVYYSATDFEGNTTTIARKIIVQDVTTAEVLDMARAVLAKIIKDDMTLDQKIRAVYIYTQRNVRYVGTGDKSSIWNAAYEGLSTGKGDCYTYYSMNVVLFDLLGITNLEVTRIGGTSHHWWNLVQFEDGKYYHVDSTPTAVVLTEIDHGKMTETDLKTYTEHGGVVNRRPNFYVYDKTLPEYQDIEIAQ